MGAKLDATENDTPEDISGFPTLVFYAKGAGEKGERYEGARTADGIIKFLEDKAPASAGGDADAELLCDWTGDCDAEEPSSVTAGDAGEPATEEPAAEETAGEEAAGEGHDEL